jgi:hypothetical protein
LSRAIGSVPLKCLRLAAGDHRVDFDDVKAPPGVIQIEVVAAKDSPPSQWMWLTIDKGDKFTNFKPLRGFVGQILVEYGTHTLTFTKGDTREEILSRALTVSAEQRVQRVTVSLPEK